jgi:low temperature requirement protein LtrA
MEAAKYEFSEAENQTIATLANRMKWVGFFLLVIGGIIGVASAAFLVKSVMEDSLELFALIFLLFAAIFLLVGIWTSSAAKSFSLIAATSGSDLSNLMNALTSLLKLYYLQFWLIIDSLIVAAIVSVILYNMNLL